MQEENKPLQDYQTPSLRSEALAFLWETIKIVVISLIIILPIRYYIVQPFFVKGASMESNFEDGDYLFIDELSYAFGVPNRGDVVIFRYPLDQSQFFIKRIIGLPSETIDIRNNKVTVYNAQHPEGIVLDETYLDAGQQTLGAMRTKLDDNEYFVLGDNRLRSSDSRVWGALNESLITGKAFIRLWPFSKVAKIPQIQY
ncbi:MAG: signal peptidase I [Patescibacteria group bacterium]